MKILVGVVFVIILGALAAAGVFMLRRPKPGEDPVAANSRMARALAVRIGVSVALFLFILLSYLLGWIHPTGVPLGR